MSRAVLQWFGVFIDTFIVLTLNALVIISTLYAGNGPLANGYVGRSSKYIKEYKPCTSSFFGVVYGDKAGAVFCSHLFILLCILHNSWLEFIC